MNCRYYKRKYPQVNEIVTCKLINYDQTGQLTVQLLDYLDTPFKQQIVPFSQLGLNIKRQSMMKEKIEELGKQFGCQVTSIDIYTNRVDLSYANVTQQQQEENFKQFSQHQKVRSFIMSVNSSLNLQNAYETLIYEQENEEYPEIYYFYRNLVDNKQVENFVQKLQIQEEKKSGLIKLIYSKFEQQIHTYRYNFVIRSFYSVQGINVIIESVQNSLKKFPDVQFCIDAPPLYYAQIQSKDQSASEELKKFAEDLKGNLEKRGASCRFDRIDKIKGQ